MGEILFLAHRLPFPPDRGDKIRSYHLLRHLARLDTVHLGAFADPQGDPLHVEALRPLVGEMLVAPMPSRFEAAKGLARGLPLSVAAFAGEDMHAFVARLLGKRPIDTIFAFSGQMAQFVPRGFAGRFVMDFVDVDSAKFEAYAQGEGGWRRWLYAGEARLLARYERKVATRARPSLFVSDAEAELFRQRSGARGVATLENGVDLTYYDPATAPVEAGPEPLILFTGQMDYRPNVDAVTGFVRDVLPAIRTRIPAARFAIVGRSPSEAVRGLAGEAVIVTGEVADVRPWLARADLVVAPLRLARGVQNKVLEAMAMGRPIVASPAAFKGIDAIADRDLVVAKGAAAEAEAVCALLADPPRRAALGAAARARAEARYSWDATLVPLAAMLGR